MNSATIPAGDATAFALGLDVPADATSARCVECGARFTDEVRFDTDADLHSMLTGHRVFEFFTAEVEDVDTMTTAQRQQLNARMAAWFGIA